MQSTREFNCSFMCIAVNVVSLERNKGFLFLKQKTFAFERSPWQQLGVNSGVHFLHHNTRAKLEKILPTTPRDIHRFINIIYYS